jgi:hypothetical protein
MITIEGNQAVARFSQFDLADYATFLKLKRTVPAPEMDLKYDWRSDSYTVKMPARYANALGITAEGHCMQRAVPLAPYLFDYQRHFMNIALERKRYALFWDCGLGKTPMALEFCRQAMALTGKRAMVCTFNLIIGEFLGQCEQFYGDTLKIEVLETRKDIKLWASESGNPTAGGGCATCATLGIMNTEKFMDKKEGLIPELRQLGCFVLDESSILKTGGGTAKWNIIKSTKGIEYKLSGSATPAPNEAMEYASQASFLETITNDGEIIWTFFTKDKAGEWYIKPHAMEAFYRFLSGWSNYMRTPAAYGFKDNIRPVPEPEFIVHQVEATPEQMQEAQHYRFEIGAGLIGDQRLGVKERMKLSQIAKGFVYENQPLAIGS